MASEDFKRKLTAVFSADAVGYSRLMGDDEAATVKTLEAYKQVMFSIIRQHRGRVIDSPGDNLLAEFASVVDAAQCSVAVQKELQARNADLPEHRRMQFRIGINLGDVIEEEDRIYGDGVNIAARLEALAKPGGIWISSGVHEQIEDKTDLKFEYAGEHQVKNIPKPIKAYRILMEDESSLLGVGRGKGLEGVSFQLPDRPSIAVLPFLNMSGDKDQEFLADGISENIITALSKIPQIFVIARNSTFVYKSKSVKVQEVAKELGVQYILEGSVQRSGDRLRINAQLIDAQTGHHLWAERYDRNLDDLFAMQDEITLKIAIALQIEMTEGEQARVRQKSTVNLDAWAYFVKAYDLFERHTKEDNVKARELLDQALALDPNYAIALSLKAVTHFLDASFGYGVSRAESFMSAVDHCQKAMALNDSDPDTLALWGVIEMAQGQFEQGMASGEKALALGPNNAEVHAMLGFIHYYAGNYQTAVRLFRRAIRLHPHYPAWYSQFLGKALMEAKQYDEALEAFRDVVLRAPHLVWGHTGSALAYVRMGRLQEAREEINKILEMDPEYTAQMYMESDNFYKDSKIQNRIIDDLRRAGLK